MNVLSIQRIKSTPHTFTRNWNATSAAEREWKYSCFHKNAKHHIVNGTHMNTNKNYIINQLNWKWSLRTNQLVSLFSRFLLSKALHSLVLKHSTFGWKSSIHRFHFKFKCFSTQMWSILDQVFIIREMASANSGESNNAESKDKRYTAIEVHLSVQNGTKKDTTATPTAQREKKPNWK